MSEPIDFHEARAERQYRHLAQTANAFVAEAAAQQQGGADSDLVIRALTIALTKTVVEAAPTPDDARRICRTLTDSMPSMVDYLLGEIAKDGSGVTAR